MILPGVSHSNLIEKSLDRFPIDCFSGQDCVVKYVFVVRENEVETSAILSPAHDFRENADRTVGVVDPSVLILERHLDERTRRPPLFSEQEEPGGTDVADVVRIRGASGPVVGNHAGSWKSFGPPLIDVGKEPTKDAGCKRVG